MTSGWQSHTAPFATNFAGRNGLPFLPGPIEERLKDSLESLPRDDSHNELTKRGRCVIHNINHERMSYNIRGTGHICMCVISVLVC